MRHFTLTTLLLTLAVSQLDAQVKRGGGLFGFGKPKEQISSGLFPDGSAPTPHPRSSEATATPAQPSSSGGGQPIFRQGRPSEVDPVAYRIEGGERVEEESPAERNFSFLPFGRRSEKDREAETSPPSPTLVSSDSSDPAPEATSPPPAVVETRQAEAAAEPIAATEVEEKPQAREDKKKNSLFSIPFFSRRDKRGNDEPVFSESGDAPLVAETVPPVAEPVAPTPARSDSPAPSQRTASTSPSAPAPTQKEESAEVPEFADTGNTEMPSNEPEKDRAGINLPNPISMIRPPRPQREIDLSDAETIIQDGEIVREQEGLVSANTEVSTSGNRSREAPREVNGVTTYSSWDDVGGRTVSAADRILNQIR